MNSENLQIKIKDKIISINKKDAIIFIDFHQKKFNYNEYTKTDKYYLI
jgi:hypothetical protein